MLFRAIKMPPTASTTEKAASNPRMSYNAIIAAFKPFCKGVMLHG
jgi:hypothetical protein